MNDSEPVEIDKESGYQENNDDGTFVTIKEARDPDAPPGSVITSYGEPGRGKHVTTITAPPSGQIEGVRRLVVDGRGRTAGESAYESFSPSTGANNRHFAQFLVHPRPLGRWTSARQPT